MSPLSTPAHPPRLNSTTFALSSIPPPRPCVINGTGLLSNVSESKGFSHLQGSHFRLVVCNNLPVVSLVQPHPHPAATRPLHLLYTGSTVSYSMFRTSVLSSMFPHESPFLRILTLTTGSNDQTVTSLPSSSLATFSPPINVAPASVALVFTVNVSTGKFPVLLRKCMLFQRPLFFKFGDQKQWRKYSASG